MPEARVAHLMSEALSSQDALPARLSKGQRGKAAALPLRGWLDVLHAALPPSGLLLIGAGAGHGEWLQWLRSRSVASDDFPVHLVEGDEIQYRYLQRNTADSANWTLWRDVIAADEGNATFYCKSNPAESGLLPANCLLALWPNLRDTRVITVENASTLDALHTEVGGRINWLFLDCLPAASLLQGGRRLLAQLDVILVRVASNLTPELSTHREGIDELLNAAGLRHIHSQTERHPALSHALYVRDAAQLRQSLKQAAAEDMEAAQAAWAQKQIALDADRVAAKQEAEQAQERVKELQARLKDAEVRTEAATGKLKAVQAECANQKDALDAAQKTARQARKQTTNLQARLKEIPAGTRQSGGDADIDDVLNDLAPFFYGRALTYVDVGAFEGKIPLKIIEHGKIRIREAHLFEPNPQSFKVLRANMDSARIPKLHLYNQGIGARDETLMFSAAKSMTKVVDTVTQAEELPGIFSAVSKRLDDLQDLLTDHHVDLLKIDVEGYEMNVIAGAERLLKHQQVDVIYIEVGFNRGGTQQAYFCDIDRSLQALGYRVFKIYEQTNEWLSDSPLLRRCNFAYMSERFAQRNPYKAQKEIFKLKEEISRMKSEDRNISE